MALYTPLDYSEEEIRLLQVDTSEAQQHKLVSNVALRSKRQQYVALSYTWGDLSRETALSVNGQMFPALGNLKDALDHVRAYWRETHGADGKRLLLWCDQICIDQKSGDEKNHQVAYMGQIYRRAEHVLVYLPVSRSVSADFKTWSEWRDWHTRQANTTDLPSAYNSPEPMAYAEAAAHQSKQGLTAAWENVRGIVESPWWQRAWVYQEFMLATRTTFLIDGLAAPWNELRDVLFAFFSKIQDHQDALAAAIARIRQDAQGLKSGAVDQWAEGAQIDEKVKEYSGGFGAACTGLHQKCKQGLSTAFDPCREGSIFRWVGKSICGGEDGDDAGEACLNSFWCVLCFKLWCPIASLQYLFVAAAYPIAYICTGPCSKDKIADFDEKQNRLREEADEKERHASELEQMAKDRLAPQTTSLTRANHAWGIANSILSVKGQMMNSNVAPLSTLMRHARNCKCGDQRDKIFAFLGLTDQSYGLAADYSPSNTLHDVVTAATAAVMRTERSLNVLHDAKEETDISRTSDHLPSWVPNFTTPDADNTEYLRFIEGIQLPPSGLSASKGRRADDVSFHADRHGNPNRVLRARGVLVGTLARIVRDDEYDKPWRTYATGEPGVEIGTRSNAIIGDEVWVLFGADVPFTLSRPSDQDRNYQILAQAMIWEGGKPSPIMYGAMVERVRRGQVEEEDVSLV